MKLVKKDLRSRQERFNDLELSLRVMDIAASFTEDAVYSAIRSDCYGWLDITASEFSFMWERLKAAEATI